MESRKQERSGSGRIVLLGTGTCQLQERRLASSVLLETGDTRLVFDFGRGIADRLASCGLRQDELRHVVLSHFHPDHLSDLVPYLQAASWSRTDPRSEDLHLYGPVGLRRLIDGLIGLFGPRVLVREDRFRLRIHEIAEERFRVEQLELRFPHLPPAGNHGLGFTRNGKTYAFTGDSSYHDREVEFLRGAELAVIDAGHLEDTEIVRLAVETRARRFVCSHLYRELEAETLNASARAAGFEGELIVGRDLMSFAI